MANFCTIKQHWWLTFHLWNSLGGKVSSVCEESCHWKNVHLGIHAWDLKTLMVIGGRPQLFAAHCEAERGRASVGWWAVEGQRMVGWRYEPHTARATCAPAHTTLYTQRNFTMSGRSIQRFQIMEKAPTRAFSWLKAPTSAFTFKTLLKTLC